MKMHATTLLLPLLPLLPLFLPLTNAHGHSVPEADPNADWATRHMAEEHHIANMDPSSFFTLHDYDSNGYWEQHEIRRTYGLDDPDTSGSITEAKKVDVVHGVLGLFDVDGDGAVSREEFVDGWFERGLRLADYGTGPGHHGDDEYEYEIHHFEKYHDENTREEDLTHPEDIAHFKKHDEMDAAAERERMVQGMQIVEMNIPGKYRRN